MDAGKSGLLVSSPLSGELFFEFFNCFSELDRPYVFRQLHSSCVERGACSVHARANSVNQLIYPFSLFLQIVFEAAVGKNFQSDIAIDTIDFIDGKFKLNILSLLYFLLMKIFRFIFPFS